MYYISGAGVVRISKTLVYLGNGKDLLLSHRPSLESVAYDHHRIAFPKL